MWNLKKQNKPTRPNEKQIYTENKWVVSGKRQRQNGVS